MRKVKFSTVGRSSWSLNELRESFKKKLCDNFHNFSRLNCYKNSFPRTRCYQPVMAMCWWLVVAWSVLTGMMTIAAAPRPGLGALQWRHCRHRQQSGHQSWLLVTDGNFSVPGPWTVSMVSTTLHSRGRGQPSAAFRHHHWPQSQFGYSTSTPILWCDECLGRHYLVASISVNIVEF